MLSVDPPLFWRCLIKYCIILTKRFISLYILLNCSSLRDINILNSTHDTLFYNFSTKNLISFFCDNNFVIKKDPRSDDAIEITGC